MLKNKVLVAFIFFSFIPFFSNAQDRRYEEWYFFTKDTTRIFVKEMKSQSKDTVIVVHGGFGANHDYMLDAIQGLENKFHFILYDQRGSLMSPAPLDKLTFQSNVSDLFELVSELKIKKVKLLCHSMGTLVGMEFARLYPELVSNLVLTGTILPKAQSSTDIFSEQMGKNLEFLANREEVKKEKSYYLAHKSQLTAKEKTEFWRISFAEANIYDISKWRLLKGGQAYYNQDASVMAESVNWNYDYRSTLNSLKATVIQGQYDFLDFNSSSLKELLKEFQLVELKMIPDAGHNSWIDEPLLFREYLVHGLTK
ncbi:alpha/beta hydrolase [Algoriphagus lacus]|uniref:Alpha/beta hydrolase n=1 Tax=Algoriphagus lacus TaxID=2056311 RepID=A0A418PND0_9BACT|nr:alpha/beta hydrolase [Algoriphagus lacus]RIW13337.1 alpha/beta hydrolase [Algoriphagus lacus]